MQDQVRIVKLKIIVAVIYGILKRNGNQVDFRVRKIEDFDETVVQNK
jgi:hypothetical protein